MKYGAYMIALIALLWTAGSPAAAQPSATGFAYPQSIFVDSQNGNIWVTDFDNNRVMRFDVSTLTGIRETVGVRTPEEYALGQNYPNPFNPATTIGFALRNTGRATVTVYSLLGQKVATLFDGVALAHARYAISFDASRLPSGMYFYALRSADRYEVKKMNLLK